MAERVAVRQGLFEDGAAPRLLGSRCDDCGAHHFPRHATCPYCSSSSVQAATLSDHGRLWAHTAVTTAPPGYRGEVPYGFGVVELPEGLRVVTRLTEPDPARLAAGAAMRLVVVPLHVDDEGRQVVTYAFAPEDATADADADATDRGRP
ncbi:MAG: Zn-ribbon domain-containing OB-fold protein [Gemmatimonadales bacterium]